MENLLCEHCNKPTFCCDCETTWSSFSSILSQCEGQTKNDVVYTPISISTMTICFNFNQFINLQLLKDTLTTKLPVSYSPGSRKSKVKKKKGTDSFYNSFDIKLTFVDRTVEPVIFSNVSIFIFPNLAAVIKGVVSLILDEGLKF